MDQRTRIGFYYVWGSSWMGGVIYARNLLKALNTLDDNNKPFIDVYCRTRESYEDLLSNTGYPYIDINIIHDDSLINKLYRGVVGLLFGYRIKSKLNRFNILPQDIMLFPFGFGRENKKLVYWRTDFQEKYLPEYFTAKEIRDRDSEMKFIAEQDIPIVFSSYDSENDYKKYYSGYSNKTFVVHFAVDHTDFSDLSIDMLKIKFGIKGEYLLCANQFWKHKNHLFMFKAYQKALQRGLKLKLVCTGRMSDYRNPDYIEELKLFIKEQNLDEDIIILGLIESNELHCLMKYSYAVVQPSLFEGWNTTVEDCKALNKFVFLSNLPVHKEQAKTNACFFNPYDEEDLAKKLLTVKPIEEYFDYTQNLREFGNKFLEVIKYVAERQ
jgi:glycosyltransferase involved in cell wall biosynthesis